MQGIRPFLPFIIKNPRCKRNGWIYDYLTFFANFHFIFAPLPANSGRIRRRKTSFSARSSPVKKQKAAEAGGFPLRPGGPYRRLGYACTCILQSDSFISAFDRRQPPLSLQAKSRVAPAAPVFTLLSFFINFTEYSDPRPYCALPYCSESVPFISRVMLRRLIPSVERLCSVAETAGCTMPSMPSPINAPLKPITMR